MYRENTKHHCGRAAPVTSEGGGRQTWVNGKKEGMLGDSMLLEVLGYEDHSILESYFWDAFVK